MKQIPDDLVVVLLRDDANAALDVKSEDESVDDHSAAIGAEDAEHDRFRIVTDRGRKRDDQSRYRDRGTELHLKVLVHDLGDDIESARRGIDRKEDRHCQTDDKQIADHVEQRIFGQRLEIRQDHLENSERGGNKDGGIDRLRAEFGSDENKAHNEENNIQSKRYRRYGQGNKIRKHHSKRRAASDRKIRRKHKEVDRRRCHHRAERDYRVFFYKFTCFRAHFSHLFFLIIYMYIIALKF